ncbi:MFS transporter [Pseudomonas moraviensis subsp. stanleyae]|uniref:MFS transporter n=1 Tax=Pseudomonas moraviensis TaxID=321662 RepID=UPI002E2FD6DF|nr:MFS transporter [Pseudomonas moraviensis]MED7670658.1 MFS transporter [Pseudomonas moraviensis subsp. stanleyae]
MSTSIKNTVSRYFSEMPLFIWILFIGTFVTRATSMMVWPFISIVLYTRFGFSATFIGLILTLSIALSSIVSFYSGYLSDKIGRLKIIVLGCVVAAMSYLLLGVSSNAYGYIAGTLLANLSWALVNNPIKTVIGDIIESRPLVERAMHLRYFFLNAGAATGPYFGLKLGISADSWSFVLVTLSYVLLLVSVLVFGKGVSLKAVNTTSFKSTMGVLAKDRLFLALVINNIIMMFIFGSFDSSLPQLMASLAFEGYLPFLASLIVLHASTIVILQLPLASALSSVSLNAKIYLGSALLIISEAGFALAAHFHDVKPLWYSAVLIMSISQTLLFPCINMFVDSLAPPNLRGAYFGAASLYGIGFSLAPIVGGIFIQRLSGPALYIFLTLASTLMTAIFIGIFRHKKTTHETGASVINIETAARA